MSHSNILTFRCVIYCWGWGVWCAAITLQWIIEPFSWKRDIITMVCQLKKAMKEIRLYFGRYLCEIEKGVKFKLRRFASLPGLFVDLYSKDSIAALMEQDSSSFEDCILSEPVQVILLTFYELFYLQQCCKRRRAEHKNVQTKMSAESMLSQMEKNQLLWQYNCVVISLRPRYEVSTFILYPSQFRVDMVIA